MKSLWNSHVCETGQVYACAVAQLRLWLVRNEQGWLVAYRHDSENLFEPLHACGQEPPELEWQRFVMPSPSSLVRLVPVLPDRSVISRPTGRIEIAPHHKGLFFVAVPVWLRVETDAAKTVTICEHPTCVMSKTWFGHPSEEGEIGYALTTRARQMLPEPKGLDDAERAVCPVQIANNTGEALALAQLLLRVRHMNVYQADDGRLWTNECGMDYTGSIYPAVLTFGRAAPAQARQAKLMSRARQDAITGLAARVISGAVFRQPF